MWLLEKVNGKNELKAYRCKLLRKMNATEWEVQWLRSKGEQTFDAENDYWTLTREEKAFEL